MANQATGATKSDIGSRAIVNGLVGKGEVVDVVGNLVVVRMPYGAITVEQDQICVLDAPS